MLGAGAMGEVYRARDVHLHRDVALKILPVRSPSIPTGSRGSSGKRRSLAALNHPNIAAIHGFEESNGMRALDWSSSRVRHWQIALRRAPFRSSRRYPIARQIAEGREALTNKGSSIAT